MNRSAGASGVTADAARAALLFAVDPVGTGGVVLRAAHGPRRDAWLAWLRPLLPAGTPWCRLPLHIADERLLGGLDLGATLHAGRPVAQRGVLADADGGVLLLAMAERLAASTAARVAAAMDSGTVQVERDGIGLRQDARFGVLVLDEGIGDDEGAPAKLLDRLAFHLRLDEAGAQTTAPGSAIEADGDGHALGLHLARGSPSTPAAAGCEPAGDAGGPPPGQAVDRTVTVGAARRLPEAGDAPLPWTAADIQAARERLPRVTAGDDIVQALCAAALALGVPSLRASLLALRTACAAAALAGREAVGAEDAALAARLVLAPRATQLPAAAQPADDATPAPAAADADRSPANGASSADEAAEPPASSPDRPTPPPGDQPAAAPPRPGAGTVDETRAASPAQPVDDALADAVLDAAVASIPAGLLADLQLGPSPRSPSPTGASGRAGAAQQGRLRGRPNGVRRGQPNAGARLNVLETLRAAAPWQAIRRRDDASAGRSGGPRLRVRRDDFRVTRFKQRSVTTTLFVVDASGSSALHRLAEAKGAVELLLADCYVRRDHVALLAFRGRAAELLLPPTRSLVRAKRSLAALPGGGGTPLAAGIDAAFSLADALRRRGETPIVVLLTDGRANIARDGTPGRAQAGDDALAAARLIRAAGFTALLLDTSARPQPSSAALANEMGAVYLPLPHAGAAGLSQAVLTVQAATVQAARAAGGAGARGRPD